MTEVADVFRVAISDRRILAFDGRRVTFSARNRDGTTARHSLDAHELVRRFLQHVLPRHFVKVRYYGLWALTNRDKLAVARGILEHHLDAIGRHSRPRLADDPNATFNGPYRCPACGTPYRDPPREIPRSRAPP